MSLKLSGRTARRVYVRPSSSNPDQHTSQVANNGQKICNVVIKIIIDVSEAEYFEKEWHTGIYEAMSQWKGFSYRSTNLINVANGKIEYLTILGFNSLENCRAWITSETRKKFMDDARDHGFILYYINEYGGSSTDVLVEGASLSEKSTGKYNLISLNDMASTAFVPRPPSKWKLFLVIWIGVYLAVLMENFSGLDLLLFERGLPLYMVILIGLTISVTILSYTFFPLFMSLPFVSKWLKAPRPDPESMNDIQFLLCEGLDIFSEGFVVDVGDLSKRIQKLEGRLNKVRSLNYNLTKEVNELKATLASGPANGDDFLDNLESGRAHGSSEDICRNRLNSDGSSKGIADDDTVGVTVKKIKNSADHQVQPAASPSRPAHEFLDRLKKQISRKDLHSYKESYITAGAENISVANPTQTDNLRDTPLTLSVLNRVKWECIEAYEKWMNEMVAEMARHEGFLGMTTIEVPTEDNTYINTFSFDNYEHLEYFITSKRRKQLVKELESMLNGSSISDVTEEHLFHSVFDELFVSTGGFAFNSHPPVWKTTVLVIIPLFFLVWCTVTGLVPVLVFDLHLSPFLVTLISTAITVSVNTYVGVPVVHLLFGKWHRRCKNISKRGSRSFFNFLDLGLSKPSQIIVLSCYVTIYLLMGFKII